MTVSRAGIGHEKVSRDTKKERMDFHSGHPLFGLVGKYGLLLEVADCIVNGLALILAVEQQREVVGSQP